MEKTRETDGEVADSLVTVRKGSSDNFLEVGKGDESENIGAAMASLPSSPELLASSDSVSPSLPREDLSDFGLWCNDTSQSHLHRNGGQGRMKNKSGLLSVLWDRDPLMTHPPE